MKRPLPQNITSYDYHECEAYIEYKCCKELRDYAGHFKDDSKPYQDFWHWICETKEIHNGCYFWLSRDDIEDDDDMPDFINEIITMFCNEFGDEIYLYVSW